MIFPRFSSNSFWNYRETCAVAGRKYSAAPLGLITVAALLPSEWSVWLIDRNIEKLPDGDLDWADMVMIGGMLPQQNDCAYHLFHPGKLPPKFLAKIHE